MRLLNLIEEHDAIRTAANLLRQLAALVIAYVARRGAEQAADSMLLAILTHIDANQSILVAKQEFGQRLGQLSLTNTGAAEEDEGANGPARVAETRAAAADGVGQRGDRLMLANDALVQALFHMQQLLRFRLHHLGHRNTSPGSDDFGNVIGVDYFVKLLLSLPRLAQGIEFTFQAQALGAFVRGALVVTNGMRLFFFGRDFVQSQLLFFQLCRQRM